MAQKCNTIGCDAAPVGTLQWIDADGATWYDETCADCGGSYARRPALRATFAPWGGK